MKKHIFEVLVEKDEYGIFTAKVPDLPGFHIQAKTMPELLERVKESIGLYLQTDESDKEFVSSIELFGIDKNARA